MPCTFQGKLIFQRKGQGNYTRKFAFSSSENRVNIVKKWPD